MPANPTPTDLGLVRHSALLAELLPFVQSDIGSMDRALENRTFLALEDGTLTPERALQAWIEKHTYRTLLRRLEQRARIGVSVGARNADAMNQLGVPNG